MGKFKLSLGNGDETLRTPPHSKSEQLILETISNEILLEKFPSVNFIEASLATLPSKNTDADFNAFIVHDANHIDIIFGDVSLKGLEATILSTQIKEFIPKENIYATNAVLPTLQTIVASIEQLSFELLRSHGAYLTLLYGRLDLEKMEFSFIDRGFTRTFILNEKGETYFLTSNFLPIGIERESDSTEETIPIHPGEKWIFYSDGLLTVRNKERQHFGFTRFAKLIQEVKHETIQSMQTAILTTIDQFRQEQEIEGEIILLILKIAEPRTIPKIVESPLLKESEHSFFELQKIQADLNTELAKSEQVKKNSGEIFQVEMLVHKILITILQKGGQAIECLVTHLPKGVKITLTYVGPVINFQEDPPLNLFIIQKNVDDVRYGKDIKGKTYIEITKLFRGE